MSRGRRKIITTNALWSERLALLDHASERLYWRVYMASDNYGVMSGKAWDVCQQATPGVAGYSRDTVRDALDRLVSVGLLERWEELDGAVWVYVVEHDRHQTADFIRKRGVRRTPVPPSESAARAAKGSKGQQRAAKTAIRADKTPIRAAKGSENGDFSALVTTTSTKTKEEPPPTSSTSHGGGGDGSHHATTPTLLPTRPEQYAAAIQGCKRALGDMRLDAESAEAAIRDERGVPDLELTWLLDELYRPLSLMVAEYPRDAVRAAIASLVSKPDVTSPKSWLRAVAEREATKPTPKRKTFAERKAEDDMAAMAASLRNTQQDREVF
jgi:hypothetical protein